MKNGFYTQRETGFITLVVNDKLYLITGDGVCMLDGCIPGYIGTVNDVDSDYFDGNKFSKKVDLYIDNTPWVDPWLTKYTVNIKDIDIEHAVSCNDLWNKTREYFKYYEENY